MAKLFPFHGYRYSSEKIERMADVVTQPYDKISPEMKKHYLDKHPSNIVRVIKNPNYGEADEHLTRWIQQGVLRRDQAPSFYPYQQTFESEGHTFSRLGVIGLLSLEDADLAVKGHERVMSDPLEDRLNLIRSTQANEGLIFMLHADPSMRVDRLLSDFTNNSDPVVTVEDEHQVVHQIWELSDGDVQVPIAEGLRNSTFYIADGHHRFRTSQLYLQECEEKGWQAGAVESFDKRMIALFNMESPSLKILPTHRGIRNLIDFDPEDFLSKLESFFHVQSISTFEEIESSMQGNGILIGLVVQDGRNWFLRLRDTVASSTSFMPDIEGPARQLDVNVLHEGILKPVLGIGQEEVASQEYVDYFRSRKELVDSLKKGQHQLGFLLNPTSLEQVRQISERGEKMPPKSTDFYPKLLTGLVLMKMEISQ